LFINLSNYLINLKKFKFKFSILIIWNFIIIITIYITIINVIRLNIIICIIFNYILNTCIIITITIAAILRRMSLLYSWIHLYKRHRRGRMQLVTVSPFKSRISSNVVILLFIECLTTVCHTIILAFFVITLADIIILEHEITFF